LVNARILPLSPFAFNAAIQEATKQIQKLTSSGAFNAAIQEASNARMKEIQKLTSASAITSAITSAINNIIQETTLKHAEKFKEVWSQALAEAITNKIRSSSEPQTQREAGEDTT